MRSRYRGLGFLLGGLSIEVMAVNGSGTSQFVMVLVGLMMIGLGVACQLSRWSKYD